MKTQKRIASKILKCGATRIWIDPDEIEEVAGAMTRGDIRKFIGLGFIKAKPNVGVSRGRTRKKEAQKAKGRRRGHGKRKGANTARLSKKERWMIKIRAQRKLLRELRDSEKIDRKLYRRAYLLSKAGTFKSKAHMLTFLKEEGNKK